jgi:hypothetical protein
MGFQNGWRGPDIVSDGLIMYLDAGSPNSYRPDFGTTWKDMSGNNYTGSLVNGPTYSTGSGGNIVFDGVNDNANLGNILFTNITNTTIDFWVNFSTFLGNSAILTKGAQGAGVDTTWASWIIGTTTTVRTRFFNSSDVSNFVTTDNLTSNLWYNLVYTYDNSNIRFYNNGSIFETAALSGPLKNCTHPIIIASDIYGFSSNIRVGTLKIYNRTLPTSEIQQNYNAQKSRFGL